MTDSKIITEKVGKLFKRYGIKSITMDDVANEMGISKKTLYQLVEDKNQLVEMTIESEFRYYYEKLHKILDSDFPAVLSLIKINGLLYEFLSDFSQVTVFDLQKYHSEFYEEIKNSYVDMFLGIIKENILIGKKERVYRKEINADMISKLHLARIEQIPNSRIFSVEEFTSPEFVKEICLYHIYGIINKKGKQHLEKYIDEIDTLLKPEAI